DPRRARTVAPRQLDRHADARHRARRHAHRSPHVGGQAREFDPCRAGVAPGTTHRRQMNFLLGLDVPPISHVTIWGNGPLGINKTIVIYGFATVATIILFLVGTRKKESLVPSGIFQNTAESGVAFVRNQIIMQTMGTDGLYWLPYLTALFFFIFFSNI